MALAVLASTALARSQDPRPTRPGRAPRVLHVPGDSATIQGAIASARDGDVVLVAPGSYREKLDFLGKAIEVIGTEGPARTRVFPPSASPVVLFRNGEGSDSRLMGFRLSNGSGDYEGSGGAVSCVGWGPVASPYLSDCVIDQSYTDPIFGNGPGAAGLDGNAILERCVLRQNETYFGSGGAVSGAVTMLQCVVENNWGCEGGGGLHLLPGSLVQDCIVRNNLAGPCGYHGSALEAQGGGIWAPFGPVEIVGSVLQANGIDEYTEPGDPGSCWGFNRGGGIHAGSGVTLRRCTIVGNRVEQCALEGGLAGTPALIDSIVFANEDQPGAYAARTSFRFSDVEGGAAGPGCIDADPLFADLGAGDLRLRSGSPCIDAGDPASPLDPDGTRADLGALHRPAEVAPLGGAWHASASLQAADPALSRSFGTAVAVAGDTALIGASEEYGGAHGGKHDAAYVFRRTGASWSEVARLTPGDPQAGDSFGAAVALDADIAVVGAPWHATLEIGRPDGAVYVFERSTSDAPFVESLRIGARRPNGGFGASLALDSGFLVVAAPGSDGGSSDELGHVYVFRRLGRGHWLEVAAFTPPHLFGSYYGTFHQVSVAISGTTIVVGVPWFETVAEVPGRVFVYERAGATPYSWVQSAVLVPTGTRGHGNFGATVSIAGDALLVGSDFGAYAYERRGPGLPWTRATRIGPFERTAVLVEGNRAWLARSSGEVRELVQSSPRAEWSEVARFAGTPGPLAASQGTLLAGAPFENSSAGAVHVFTRGVQLDSLGSDQAADEEEVALRGLALDTVTRVLVGGAEQPIVRQSASELVLRPLRRDPGFADLELVTTQGTLTLDDAFASLPTLRVVPGGPGGTTEAHLENGTSGAFVLLASLDLRATLLTVSDPPTWYGLWLDLVPGRSGRLAIDAFGSSGEAAVTFPMPASSALAGLSIHTQAWCRRGLFGHPRQSFTNVVTTTF